ncbi:MAG: hypothetical protein JXR25_07745 [Pontiellaceae bacterium]|nr:hypothetical protein [Pontiellaceae bacterium]MBN2784703.1 hypothetical protein [Pontiellaceae bacterium]
MKLFKWITFSVSLLSASAFAQDYTVEGNIGKGQFKQLAIAPGDLICGLNTSGEVVIYKADGSEEKIIKTGLNGAEALAVSPNGSFHVFSNIVESKKVKSGARMVSVNVPVGVQDTVFDANGVKADSYVLNMLKSVKTARFIGEHLVVADLTARTVVVIDPESHNETARIQDGLRLCCGIFDVCAAPEDTLAISNLGAFKLQQFSMDGKLVTEFGKRGRELNDFHGCCNPVSAAYLPSGEILTVEKDPTRIKIYDAKGEHARQIDGVDELVKGCSYIPVIVDSQGNIYLAAATKNCIVKCVKK